MKRERVVCGAINLTIRDAKGIIPTNVINIPFIDENDARKIIDAYSDQYLNYEYAGCDLSSVSIANIFGFVTNKNRFVTPEEALKITGWGNQLRFRGITELTVEEFYRY